MGVIKKSDPCGNKANWFVDNGLVKGFVVSSVLTPFENNLSLEKNSNVKTNEDNDSKFRSSFCSNNENGSFILNENESNNAHNYVNCENISKTEVNINLYFFKF